MKAYKRYKTIKKRARSAFYWRMNRLLFKWNGIKYGENLIVNGFLMLDIADTADVVIGDDCFINSGSNINPLAPNRRASLVAEDNAKINIGNHCGFSSGLIWARKSIEIGNYVNIGADSIIIDSDQHSLDYEKRHSLKEDQAGRKDVSVVIEDDVLIGTRCIILKGVRIGARSIIGAGSVVTSDIPSDCIAAGNPAKVIKYIDNKR